MTVGHQYSVAATTDDARAVATLTTAFGNDPVTRWVLPEACTYLHFWPKIVEAFGGRAFGNGTAHSVAGHSGIALWLAPGITSDEDAMKDLLTEAVDGAVATMSSPSCPGWTSITRSTTHTGTCRSWAWIFPIKAAATDPRYCVMRCSVVTRSSCPPTSKRRARRTSGSTSGTGSKRSA